MNRSKNQFCTGAVRWVEPGIFCGIFWEYSGEYSLARLELGSARRGVRTGWRLGWTRLVARLGLGVSGSARLQYGARVAQSSSTSGRVGCAWAIWLNIQAARVGDSELRFG